MKVIGTGRIALLLAGGLLLGAAPAGAVWGPFGGVARLESEDAAAGVFDGFEAGIVAFGPDGEGFWQAAFGRLDQAPGAGRITRVAARLNFTVLANSAAVFYVGPMGARNWLVEPAGERKHWSYGAQGGMLLSLGDVWRRLRSARGLSAAPAKVGVATGSFLLGAEAGWTQAPAPLQGLEFRGFATLLY